MRVVRATGATLESLLDDTFPLWGDGLTRRGYGHWNIAQERTDWGSRHLRRCALMDGARVLSSAKRYDLSLWLKGRRVLALGVGAVFTPESQRGHGHALAIIKALEDQALSDGAEMSLLFSEIGPSFYERLGYARVPVTTVEIEVQTKDGAPAMLVRGGEDRDAPHVAEMYAQRARHSSWRFSQTRRTFGSRCPRSASSRVFSPQATARSNTSSPKKGTRRSRSW